MNEDEIFDILLPLLQAVTGLDGEHIILGDPDEGAPTGQYMAVRPLQNIDERGGATVKRKTSLTAASVDVSVHANIIAQCNINVYRGNAMSLAQKIKRMNLRPDVSAALFKAKMGWNRTSQVNNLTTLQSGRQEPRAQISVFLSYQTTDLITINSIEQVAFDVQYENGVVVASGDVTTPDVP